MNPQEAIAVDMEERLQVACGQVNAAHVQLVALAAEALRTEAWAVAGIRTPCQWLAWQSGVSAGTARRILRLAAASETHPLTYAVFAAGRLSLEQAAVAVTAPARWDAQFAELAPLSTVAQLKIEVRAATPAPEPTEPDTTTESVTKGFDDAGRFALHADLDP
ncbi:MAG: hypothetical protein ACR2HP_15630, partial [Ilumatobacteraceae bacterium]